MSESEQSDNNGFQVVSHRRNHRQREKELLDKVASGDIKPDEAQKIMYRRKLPRFVVTRNGKIALFNIQKTPIVLYADQWEKIENLMKKDVFSKFLDRSKDIIKTKKSESKPPGLPDPLD